MNTSQLMQRSVILRIVMALSLFGVMLLTSQPTASAQQCAPGCAPVTINNCTQPPRAYNVQFVMCCNGLQALSPFIAIPPAPPLPVPPPPPPFPCFTFVWAPPAGCTILGVANILPPPPAGWFFNPATCTLQIF